MNDHLQEYQFLFANMTQGVFFQDADGTLVDVNPAALSMLGLSREQFLGRTSHHPEWRVINEDGTPLLPEQHPSMAALLSGASVRDFIAGVYNPGLRGVVWLQINATPMFRAGETLPYRVFVTLHDITSRKQAELALRESEERYRRLIATANEGIAMTDAGFFITYANPQLERILGFEPGELTGTHVSSLIISDDYGRAKERMISLLQGQSSRGELCHRRKDGSLAWLLTSISPLLDEDGAVVGSFAMLTDLTDRKAADSALQQALAELELRVEERTADLAEANLEIRKMSYDLLRAGEQERARIAAELHDQVGQSLLLAKMKLDMLSSELRPAAESHTAGEISALLESSLRDIRSLVFAMRPPLLDSAGLKAALERLCVSLLSDYHLKVDFTCNCRSLSFAAEERYSLYQTVRELLLNVVKHAGTDSARLSITEKGGSILFRVVDRGAGFASADQAERQGAASGFGLFNVRQRIENMSGCCNVASTPGQGTAVTLTVPQPEKSTGA